MVLLNFAEISCRQCKHYAEKEAKEPTVRLSDTPRNIPGSPLIWRLVYPGSLLFLSARLICVANVVLG